MPVPLDGSDLGPDALEGPEQPAHVLGRDAHAGVDHRHADPLTLRLAPDRDRALFAVVLGRIGKQVHQHLAQPQAVGHHLPDAVAAVLDQAQAARLDHRLRQRHGLRDDRRQVERLDGDLHLADLDARHFQQILDHSQQVVAGPPDLARPAELLGRRGTTSR